MAAEAQAQEIVERAINLGLGFVTKTVDSVKDFIDDAEKSAKKYEKSGEKATKDLESQVKSFSKKLEERGEEIRENIKEEVNSVLGRLGIVTSDDVEKLEKRLERLEHKIAGKRK